MELGAPAAEVGNQELISGLKNREASQCTT